MDIIRLLQLAPIPLYSPTITFLVGHVTVLDTIQTQLPWRPLSGLDSLRDQHSEVDMFEADTVGDRIRIVVLEGSQS